MNDCAAAAGKGGGDEGTLQGGRDEGTHDVQGDARPLNTYLKQPDADADPAQPLELLLQAEVEVLAISFGWLCWAHPRELERATDVAHPQG